VVPPAAAYIHFDDKVAAEMLRWGIPWRFPCADVQRSDQCFKFSRPELMSGLWRNQFEGSQFCARETTRCQSEDDAAFVALSFAQPLLGDAYTPPGGLYAVEFIGRRSLHGGRFGHFGMADNAVIVDRLIAIREIEAPDPGGMTEALAEGYRDECRGAEICIPNSGAVNWKERHRR
jgi:hypothetical protein